MSALEHYAAQYRRFAGNGAAAGPGWLKDVREAALTRFAAVGFPTAKEEGWRFTSVQPIAETSFTHAAAAWEVGHAPAGAVVTSLVDALRQWPDLVRTHLARHAAAGANPFTALATAFLGDGVFIHVAARTAPQEPLRVTYRRAPGSPGHCPMFCPRTLIVLEPEARATVVESYAGAPDGVYFANAVTEVVLGDGARLDHVRIQQESESAYHVATTQSVQGRDSVLHSTAVALGGALSRHDIGAVLDGTGASLILNGLSLLRGRQHADHHTTIDHARPHCESHELFNGVYDGHARGVFTGRIIVRPGAQRTDSKQTNNNLLLSEDARADSLPQLEIYADDVKCTHGATLGPLDPTALFYLRSRGVGLAEARGLLTYGFGADILSRIGVPAIRQSLDSVVRARLGVAGVEPLAA